MSLSLEAPASIGEAEPDPQAPAAPVRQERMRSVLPYGKGREELAPGLDLTNCRTWTEGD